MPKSKRIEITKPSALSSDDLRAWEGFILGRPDLIGPYFDVRYVIAIAATVPKAFVARILDASGQIVGFFPYQMRGKTAQPLGAPLSDYHGIIGAVGLEVDYQNMLKAMKAERLEFYGWIGELTADTSTLKSYSQIADLSQGYEAYIDRHSALNSKFFKNVARCQRNVEKDFNGFSFSFEPVTPEILEWVIDKKRTQYERSGQHDVFGCGWTQDMLARLADFEDRGFGLKVGLFRYEDVLVAAEICLMREVYIHLWFPAYNNDYHRYSPGILLSLKIMEHATSLGITKVDFGAGGEAYKHTMTEAALPCFEGEVVADGQSGSRMADALIALLPSLKPKIEGISLSIRRRLRIIRACETEFKGKLSAGVSFLRRAFSRLRSKPTKS
jgi:CelD/BcsL family acetyltransferase involved in cellulose biosynthesis